MANRLRFATIALATALPVVIFAAVVTGVFFRQERRGIEQILQQAASNAVQAIDSQLDSALSSLKMVAGIIASVPPQTIPVQFQVVAAPALRQHPEWLALVLSRGRGSETLIEARRSDDGIVINVRRAEPEDGRGTGSGVKEAIVGDVLVGGAYPEPVVVMRVPVVVDGKALYTLAAVVRAWHFTQALQAQQLPESWFSRVYDAQGNIVARSRAQAPADASIGRPMDVWLRADAADDIVRGRVRDGPEAFAATRRSSLVDWDVAVGAPAAALDRIRQGTLAAVAVGALATGLLTLILFLATGRALARREEEERQRESDRRVADIAAHFPGVIYRRVLHPDGHVTYPYVSEGLQHLLEISGREGREPVTLEDFAHRFVHPEDAERWQQAVRHSASTLGSYDEEGRYIDAQGRTWWLRTAARPHRDASGAIVWDGFILDVTDLKTTEKQLRRSLQEKDTLLREVHHRVKNNLQAIWGMLQIESSRLQNNPAARERLDALGQRIAVLGRIHQQLYAADLLTQVDMAAQIRQLCQSVQDFGGDRVRFVLDLEPLVCDLETALPLSLITNELVSNALKHAFPGDRRGTIRIGLKRLGETVRLRVEDDGIGAKPDTLEAGLGIGTTLVKALAGQIDAEMRCDCPSGCRIDVEIPGSRFAKGGEPAADEPLRPGP